MPAFLALFVVPLIGVSFALLANKSGLWDKLRSLRPMASALLAFAFVAPLTALLWVSAGVEGGATRNDTIVVATLFSTAAGIACALLVFLLRVRQRTVSGIAWDSLVRLVRGLRKD